MGDEAKAKAEAAEAEAKAKEAAELAELEAAEAEAKAVAKAAKAEVKLKRGEIMLRGAMGEFGRWRAFVGGKRIDEQARVYSAESCSAEQIKALKNDPRVEFKG